MTVTFQKEKSRDSETSWRRRCVTRRTETGKRKSDDAFSRASRGTAFQLVPSLPTSAPTVSRCNLFASSGLLMRERVGYACNTAIIA